MRAGSGGIRGRGISLLEVLVLHADAQRQVRARRALLEHQGQGGVDHLGHVVVGSEDSGGRR